MTARQAEYQEYLKTEHWQQLRAAVLLRDGNKCVLCDSRFFLQAHHKRYRDKFEDSPPEDLITLCRNCHRTVHHLDEPEPRKARRRRVKPPIDKTPADLTTEQGIRSARARRKISRKQFKKLIRLFSRR